MERAREEEMKFAFFWVGDWTVAVKKKLETMFLCLEPRAEDKTASSNLVPASCCVDLWIYLGGSCF